MIDHASLLPLYAAGGTPLLALVVDLATGKRTAVAGSVLFGGLATIICALVGSRSATFCTAAGLCSWTPSSRAVVAAVLFAGLTVGVLALSLPSLRAGIAPPGEYCFLLASSMAGGVVIGYAGDLITLIVGLETLTLPLYVLVGLRRFAPREPVSSHGASASVTFFLISVISTAIALLGAALNYAATGALHLSRLVAAIGPTAPVARVGVALLVIGFAFKVAAVPLHAWAPSTYDGAPIPIAAYLSTASKLGGVFALVAVVSRLDARPVTAVLAVLTMTVGNLVALAQTRIVRLLAWSSIAQAGYILAALALGAPGVRAALVYAVFFVVLEFLAFGVLAALRAPGADGGTVVSYRGAGRRYPWLGAALILSVAGLAGLPPGLAGLFAKVTVVDALIDRGWGWLAGVVALNAVIALAYYVRVAATFYTTAPLPSGDLGDEPLAAAAAAGPGNTGRDTRHGDTGRGDTGRGDTGRGDTGRGDTGRSDAGLGDAGRVGAGLGGAGLGDAGSGDVDPASGRTPAAARASADVARARIGAAGPGKAVVDRTRARTAAAELAPAAADPAVLAAMTDPRRPVARPVAIALIAAAAVAIALGFAPQLLFSALT